MQLCYIQASAEMENDSSQKHNLNLRKSTQGTGMGQLDHLRTATVLGQLGMAMKHFSHLRESSQILVAMNMHDR